MMRLIVPFHFINGARRFLINIHFKNIWAREESLRQERHRLSEICSKLILNGTVLSDVINFMEYDDMSSNIIDI